MENEKVTVDVIPFDSGEMNVDSAIETGDIEPEKKEPDYFIVVEKMPEPKGGYVEFYKILNHHIKYPAQAKRMHAKGKVVVEFIVDENGELQNMIVLKGIGMGCDEEAMRVIRLTKWNAGRQRGTPVKVKMVQPIYFDLR